MMQMQRWVCFYRQLLCLGRNTYITVASSTRMSQLWAAHEIVWSRTSAWCSDQHSTHCLGHVPNTNKTRSETPSKLHERITLLVFWLGCCIRAWSIWQIQGSHRSQPAEGYV